LAAQHQAALKQAGHDADLKQHRGLMQLTVRGLAKAKCVALWCALAYNLMHFGPVLSH
jgi:hypothetical protein